MNVPGPGHRNPMERRLETASDKRQTLRRLTRLVLRHYRAALPVAVGCIAVTGVATLCSTLFTRHLVDDYILPLSSVATPDFSPLAAALGRLSLVLAAGVVCAFVSSRLMIRVSEGTMRRLRRALFDHMETLPVSYFDVHPRGALMSVYTNDVDTLRQLIGQSLPQAASSVLTLAVTLVAMAFLSLPLTGVSLVVAACMALATACLGRRAKVAFSRQQESLGQMNAYTEEMMAGQPTVLTCRHGAAAIAAFERLDDALRRATCDANRTASTLMPVNANLGTAGYVLIGLCGAAMALSGGFDLTLGTLVAFLTLNSNFTRPVAQLSQQVNSIMQASAGAERAFRLLDSAAETDDGTVGLVRAVPRADGTLAEGDGAGALWAWKVPTANGGAGRAALHVVRGDVVLRDVTFGYSPSRPVLRDVSLTALEGQKIALLGGTGAGKTTVTSLLCRFYEAQRGSISIDGFDVRRLCKGAVRRALATVQQETHLFAGSVMDNIRYGRLEATDAECVAAARSVGADSFVERLKGGYAARLQPEGANLSQGERQLLCLARAAVAAAPLLVLDEATSSVDTRTERLAQQGMERLVHGRTAFVIAHRLSTTRGADTIVVLQHGRVTERGTHAELMRRGGRYFELYTGKKGKRA